MAMIRKAKPNKFQDKFHLTGFLWRNELDALAKKYGVATKARDLIKEVRRQISDALPINEIRSHVLACLKQRYR
jgi:hypothetical protein